MNTLPALYTQKTATSDRVISTRTARPIEFSVSQRYWNVIGQIPSEVRVPEPLVKIGVVANEFQLSKLKIEVIRSSGSTSRLTASSNLLGSSRKYMSELHQDNNLNKFEKQQIGDIITESGLGRHPHEANCLTLKEEEGKYQGLSYRIDPELLGLMDSHQKSYDDGYKQVENNRITEAKSGLEEQRKRTLDDIGLDKTE